MQTLLSNLHVGNVNFVVGILYAIIVLYETKFEEPITFFWGKPKLFKGTKKQKIYSWFVFLLTVIFFLWQV